MLNDGSKSDLLTGAIQHESLADKIYGRLRVAIMTGQLSPGEKLIYRTLAMELGVSPTPVRDAVHRLISDGVLVMDDRGAAMLPQPDPIRYIEIISLRIELEGRAAARVAQTGGADTVQELIDLNVRLEEARRLHNINLALELNELFHFSIIRKANMPVMESLLHSLWLQCGPTLQFLYTEDYPKVKSRHPHYDLIEAIKFNDPEAARQSIRQDLVFHGRHVLRRIYELIGEQAPDGIPEDWA